MDIYASALTVFLLLFFLLGAGLWLFASFLLLSVVGLIVTVGMDLGRVGAIMSQVMWRSASAWELSAIPLFILMGDIIFHTDMASRLFRGLSPWVDRIPGRLIHANIGGCTLFAAICGSSVATTATIAKITVGELRQRGYDQNLALGSLAGAGTFGLMIPPSINMIIYGVLAEVSIAKMFAAGVIPGAILALSYSGYIMLRCLLNPSLAPGAQRADWRDRFAALRDLGPIVLLIVVVLGSIYTGVATPSESAVMGLLATVVMTLASRQLTLCIFATALMNTVKTSSMLLSLMAAASFMSAAMGYMHVPQDVSTAISSLHLHPFALILVLGLVYVALGCALDGVSMMVMSVPIVLPLVVAAGYDPIWFGVFLVVMAELGQLTPPIGFNLFVLQGMTGIGLSRLSAAAFPFFVITCLVGALLAVFPGLVLWLPGRLF
ncbi:TRAP transporter large permease subunit [Ancylobacter sp. MQZ15Z-1]|uniref:TRAP transporter large permease protein n=1 Tax=Ancylobacter mangrovi TaxID=2972472 RepID=A0A9X2P9D1_9HYPH|nr:TRAP transporter large permease subunit [Ancylobacter mangrovi]MCS0494607.1 TRAP transporter large permease subunit [Ancylobacter mangrovi]